MFVQGNNKTGDHHIYQGYRYKNLPSKVHELVEPKSRYSPTYPHKNENQKKNFGEKYSHTQDGKQVWTVCKVIHSREIVSSKKQDGHNGG